MAPGVKVGEGLGGLFVLFLIAMGMYGIYLIDFGFARDQISDYFLFCENPDYDNRQCPGRWIRGPHIIYTVNKDQQVVIRQAVGSPPDRLSQCAVVDRTNWKCNYEPFKDHVIPVGFADGNVITDGVNQVDNYYMRHVSRYEWIAAKEAVKK